VAVQGATGTKQYGVCVSAIISNAQNREDVVLWRALRRVTTGRYVEVGANHPTHDSVSRLFYDHGWSGITVEPVPHFAALQRAERPRDVLVEAAISNTDAAEITLHVVPDTGLSTTVDSVSDRHQAAGIEHDDVVVPAMSLNALLAGQGLAGKDIHFLLIDVEGAEADVLRSIDLDTWRPWVLVIEATAPTSTTPTHQEWEDGLLSHGYEFCLFDGLSRFYVAAEKADDLRHDLSYPASIWDDYKTAAEAAVDVERGELMGQIIHWRSVALSNWADTASREIQQRADLARLRRQIRKLRDDVKHMRASTSWRLTAPLRKASRLAGRR
jgi:FkbM family methyltransferase